MFPTIFLCTYHHERCEFEFRSGEVYSIQHYVIKFVSDLRQVGGFLHQSNWPPRYNFNIVESDVKLHNHHNISF